MRKRISIWLLLLLQLGLQAQDYTYRTLGCPVWENDIDDDPSVTRYITNGTSFDNIFLHTSYCVTNPPTFKICYQNLRAAVVNNQVNASIEYVRGAGCQQPSNVVPNVIKLNIPSNSYGTFQVWVEIDNIKCTENLGTGCTSGDGYGKRMIFNYCVVNPSSIPPGDISYFITPGYTSYALNPASQSVTIPFNWDLQRKNLCDPLVDIQYKLTKYNGVAVAGATWSGWKSMALGGTSHTATSEGVYEFDFQTRTQRGTVYTYTGKQITVLPSCGLDTDFQVDVIPAPGSNASPAVRTGVLSGWQIDPKANYEVKITGITDFTKHYSIATDARAEEFTFSDPLVLACSNGCTNSYKTSVQIKQNVGSYRLYVTKKKFNFPSSFDQTNVCLNPFVPSFFVGGQDKLIHENCWVYLPEYLTTRGYSGSDYTLEHFTWTISSSQGIVMGPGVVLEAGGELKIETLPSDNAVDPDANLNFSHQTTFDDYGRPIATSRNYFDNRGMPTQVQSKNLVTNTVLAQQSLYDQFGRPSLQTLPAPIKYSDYTKDACGNQMPAGEQLNFVYKEDFLRNTSGTTQYRYENFDNDKIPNPDKPQQTSPGTLGWYYSANNKIPLDAKSVTGLEEPYTASTDYPFVQTEYTNDGTPEAKSVIPPSNIFRTNYSTANGRSYTEPLGITALSIIPTYLKMRKEALPDANTPANLTQNAWQTRSIDNDGTVNVTVYDKGEVPLFTIQALGSLDESVAMGIYDDAGQLRYVVSPNGYASYTQTTSPVLFPNLDKTTYEYDAEGRLEASVNNDEGRVEMKYRTDGQIRFSQNAEQKAANPQRYSYTHYDRLGRPYENGEYTVPAANGVAWAAITSILLDNIDPTKELPIAHCTERVLMYYNGIGDNCPSTFTRSFLRGKVSGTEKVGVSKTWYSYDERGRVVATLKLLIGLSNKYITTTYSYHPVGGIQEVAYQPGIAGEQFYHSYEYFADGTLAASYIHLTKPVYDQNNKPVSFDQKVASYEYYKHGPLKTIHLADKKQSLNYFYTPEGWLKAINHPSLADNKALFGEELHYYVGDYNKIASTSSSLPEPHFNGTVAGKTWRSITGFGAGPSYTPTISSGGYRYSYDKKSQLKAAEYGTLNTSNAFVDGTNVFDENNLSYDLNGNIKALNRYDQFDVNFPTTRLSKYTYRSNANTLLSVQATPNTEIKNDLVSGYNQIGQCTTVTHFDNNKHLISYNAACLTAKIEMSLNGVSKGKVEFEYDETGNRIVKKYTAASGVVTSTWYIRDASGNVQAIYDNNGTSNITVKEYPIYAHQKVATYYPASSAYIYDISDHLGNTRVRFSPTATGLGINIDAYANYYPYGLEHNGGKVSLTNRYKYQGLYAEKDLETDSKYNSFLLRNYSGMIGRWLMPDPYKEFYSPYVGMGNNPVGLVDPDGGSTNGDGDKSDPHINSKSKGINWSSFTTGLNSFTRSAKDWWNAPNTFPKVLTMGTQLNMERATTYHPEIKTNGDMVKYTAITVLIAYANSKNLGAIQNRRVEPNSLIRTERGQSWKIATGKVASIMGTAKTQGILEPVDVFLYNGKTYIINGHHRVEAAKRLNQTVPVNYVTIPQGYSSAAEVQEAAFNANLGNFKVDGRYLNELLR